MLFRKEDWDLDVERLSEWMLQLLDHKNDSRSPHDEVTDAELNQRLWMAPPATSIPDVIPF